MLSTTALASTKNSKWVASLVISRVMYCKFVAGIGEIELDMVIFEHHTVCSTEINKARTCLIHQPYKSYPLQVVLVRFSWSDLTC